MTIYIEHGFPAQLVPVTFIGYAKSPMHDVTKCVNAVVKIKRDCGAYKKGDYAHMPPRCVVEKAGFKNYHQLVKPAKLPAIDYAKLMDSRG